MICATLSSTLLRWAAAGLQEACRRPTIITPQDRWRIDRETLTTEQILAAADAARANFLKEENKPSDQKILAATAKMFHDDIPKDQHPIGFYDGLKSFGDLGDEKTYRTWAASVFANTMIFNDAKWKAFTSNPDAVVLQDDPAYAYAAAFGKNYLKGIA